MTSMTEEDKRMHKCCGAFMFPMNEPCKNPECVEMWACYCQENAIRAAEAKKAAEKEHQASMPRSEMCNGQNCVHCTKKGVSRPSGELVCNYHALTGSCAHGPECKFLHLAGKSLEDYKKCHRIPVSGPNAGRISNWNGKRYGKCKIPNCKGDCTFGHVATTTTKKPCRYGDKCKIANCKFGHDTKPCRYGEKCKTRDSGCKFWHGATSTDGVTNTGGATNSDHQDDDEEVIAEGIVERNDK